MCEGNLDHIRATLLKGLRCQRLLDVGLFINTELQADPQCNDYPSAITTSLVEQVCELVSTGTMPKQYRFMAEDLFIRQRIESVQAMFSQWMARAAAQVNGEQIPFKKIITWCQNCHEWDKRHMLKKEARALCKFLAPFSHATWQALKSVVQEELGYPSYLAFCQARRPTALGYDYVQCKEYLEQRRTSYMTRVEAWVRSLYPSRRLAHASRFDAIYLLGMRYLDESFSKCGFSGEKALEFFSSLGLDYSSGISIHVDGSPGRQTYCVPIRVPGEIHLIIGPVTGWLDWEALFHEMGHAFSFVNADPGLPEEEREYWTSGAVSETMAFLFQQLSMKKEFLEYISDGALSPSECEELHYTHSMKFEVLTRRYGAKFLIEYENFSRDHISKGQDLYAETMQRETGFHYDPETYLFDLMPDFYSLDYFQAFLASGLVMETLEASFGPWWFLDPSAMSCLRQWVRQGNSMEVHSFVRNLLGIELYKGQKV